MRRVAGGTAFCFDREMFIHEWAAQLRVAFETDLILVGAGTQLMGKKSTVFVVAIGTVDQAFIYSMMIRAAELSANLRVTTETEHRSRCLEESVLDLGRMHRMATGAANTVFQMHRAMEITAITGLMATLAEFAHLLGAERFVAKDFCHVAAARDVRRSGSVARFAAVRLDIANHRVRRKQVSVRIRLELVELFLVASFADI